MHPRGQDWVPIVVVVVVVVGVVVVVVSAKVTYQGAWSPIGYLCQGAWSNHTYYLERGENHAPLGPKKN